MEDVLRDAEAAGLTEDAEELAGADMNAVGDESNDPEMQLDGTDPDVAPQVSMRRDISIQLLMIMSRWLLPLLRPLSSPQKAQPLQTRQGRRFPLVPCRCPSRLSRTVRTILHVCEHSADKHPASPRRKSKASHDGLVFCRILHRTLRGTATGPATSPSGKELNEPESFRL